MPNFLSCDRVLDWRGRTLWVNAPGMELGEYGICPLIRMHIGVKVGGGGVVNELCLTETWIHVLIPAPTPTPQAP